ncbi:MAG TPA: hypothetical protein VJ835_02110, partial [Fimbriimonadaceae bacterium]|nr:hypothetical protein [Fimbriimonadaceae bacterium]
ALTEAKSASATATLSSTLATLGTSESNANEHRRRQNCLVYHWIVGNLQGGYNAAGWALFS